MTCLPDTGILGLGLELIPGNIGMYLIQKFPGAQLLVLVLKHFDEDVKVGNEGLVLIDRESAYIRLLIVFFLVGSFGHFYYL